MDRYLMQTVQVFFSPFHPTVAGLCRRVKAAGCCWSPLLSTADIPGGVVFINSSAVLWLRSNWHRHRHGRQLCHRCYRDNNNIAAQETGSERPPKYRQVEKEQQNSTKKNQQRLDVSAFKFYRFLLEIWLADRTTAAKAIMSRHTCD